MLLLYRRLQNGLNPHLKVRCQIKALVIDDEADHGSDTRTGEQWDSATNRFETSESEINRSGASKITEPRICLRRVYCHTDGEFVYKSRD